MGRRTRTIETEVEIDLEAFTDQDIRDEFELRGLTENNGRDFDRLAELIAEGNRDEALDLLRQISPDILHPTTIKRLADDRRREAA